MRHPKPAIAEGVCYGASDVDLAEPIDLAGLAALPAFDHLISSPLRRCRVLADAIGAARGLEPMVDTRLREMDFGVWEGRAWDDISRQELDEWATNFEDARPHGGESVAQLAARVDAALTDHLATNDGCLIIITHAGVIRAATRDWRMPIPFGALVHL